MVHHKICPARQGGIVTIGALFKKISISYKSCQISCASNIRWPPGITKVFEDFSSYLIRASYYNNLLFNSASKFEFVFK